ncbi:MAG: hypothetical protein A3F84_08310 [Candidatus Handelsmanbacteria bacterium RIFCSPLOWO2_12_FULL_64_10]|uniref:DUF2283 domain-containing protein n=1 Tax=Handelsmanbacteria sp. (strain RIFCSPLOWO2_12_FULL_64_10) TaxID=1817868 RepID=A0A1F6D1N7_HANXR|nr:MAG: hypothetical protein A3F84_08310 [Candidatus Handelsmanbacteria bacterium RIFCSPLOWO2_12_FULL_64_10]
MINGKPVYYEYDEYQDALFVTFEKEPPLSYYEEPENGILIRREAETDRIVGYTVRNVSLKVCQQYASILSTP